MLICSGCWRAMISTDCSFPFGNGRASVLANCSFCGNKANLSFSASPVCSGFSAEACSILHALGWFRQHQQVCHLSFPLHFCHSVLSFLFYLKLWQELSFLSFFTMRLQWVPGHLFFPGSNMVDDVAKRGALLLPCAISCALCLFPHTSRIHSLSFL